MINFQKNTGKWPGKGEWAKRTIDGKVTAEIACPLCGNFGSLRDHDIKEDGTVSPSIVCPYEKEYGCKFHDWGKLAGWTG